MKRTLIIIASSALLIFLIVRMIIVSSNRLDERQREFVSLLDYDLSARVDSVVLFNPHAPVGFLHLTITRGNYVNREKKIGRSMKKGNSFRLLIDRDSTIQMFSKDAREYRANDSLVINSREDLLIVFREGNKLIDRPLSTNLSGGN